MTPSPKICVSVAEGTAARCRDALARFAFVEVRLDRMQITQAETRSLFSTKRPLIATCRPGKPDAGVYVRALAEVGREAAEVLLVDNHVDYLAPFRAMGGSVLLIDENGTYAARDGLPRLRHIKELPAYLASLR